MIRKLRPWLSLSICLIAAGFSGQAWAAASADATIFNKAKLTYSGGTAEAAVSVTVALVGAEPALTSSGDTSVTSGATTTILYTVTSNSNGLDNYDLGSSSLNTPLDGSGSLTAPTVKFLSGSTGTVEITDFDLGAAITATNNDAANQVLIPAGSEVNLAVGMYVNVTGFGVYRISGITAGTVADINNDEVYSRIDLDTTTDLPADTRITGADFGVSAVGGAIQLGEQAQFRLQVTGGGFTGDTSSGTHDITVSVDPDSDPGDTAEDIVQVQVNAALVFFTKKIAPVTGAALDGTGGTVGTYVTTPFDVATGDVLSYQIEVGPTAGQPAITDAVITDTAPDYTLYVEDSLTLNGVQVSTVIGGDGGTLPLEAGLAVNSQGGPSDDASGNDGVGAEGIIDPNNSAVLTFRVIVE